MYLEIVCDAESNVAVVVARAGAGNRGVGQPAARLTNQDRE